MRRIITATCLTLLLGVTGAAAHHKAGHHMPPGQAKKMLPADFVIVAPPVGVEDVCLVTTATPGDVFAPIIVTEWLSRRLAEQEAAARDSFIIYHPDYNTEEGCLGL
ncbi:hypothetical protein [Devosia sp.]|uniref:hypothetical protein n=2 Tax=Devosia sp. TaxID=1871048 RepID=UPI002FC9ADC0